MAKEKVKVSLGTILLNLQDVGKVLKKHNLSVDKFFERFNEHVYLVPLPISSKDFLNGADHAMEIIEEHNKLNPRCQVDKELTELGYGVVKNSLIVCGDFEEYK